MGTAILRGIFTATKNGAAQETSVQTPTKYVACVVDEKSAKRVENELFQHKGSNELTILANKNSEGIQAADIIILATEPRALQEVLEPLREQLSGKLLVSILAGVTVEKISSVVRNEQCTIARVLPNTSAAIGESMTAFANDSGLSEDQRKLVNWVFSCVGEVLEVPTRLMDISTALSGSGVAFAALMLEAMAAGGVAMGLAPRDAQVMAAQVMKGTAQQVLNGEHAAVLRDKVTTPGGCTIAGLCSMEESGVRGGISKAIREATTVVGQLGKGVQNPNRTNFY